MATTDTTTESTGLKTRSWDHLASGLMLLWVAVGFVYYVTVGDMAPARIYLWLAVMAALTVAHIAPSVRRR